MSNRFYLTRNQISSHTNKAAMSFALIACACVSSLALLVFSEKALGDNRAYQDLDTADIDAFSTSNQHINQQRYHYELAKSSLKNKKLSEFEKYYRLLFDYPLITYLDYAKAGSALKSGDVDKTIAFIRNQKNSYLGDRLHRQYLHSLAQSGAWSDLVYWYRKDLSSPALTCHWLNARLKTGDKSVLSEIADIWTKPRSQPKACDKVFSVWLRSDYFTSAAAWKRYILASKKSKRGLARYAASLLPSDFDNHIKLVGNLDARPYTIAQYQRFSEYSPKMQQIIVFGIQKYARQNPSQALRHWRRYEGMHPFDPKLAKQAKTYILARLLNKGNIELAKSMLSQSPSLRKPKAIEKLIRKQLHEQSWRDVLATIDLLPKRNQDSDRWTYWRARAELALNSDTVDSAHPSYAQYRKLAQKRSFYGFLSADILGQQYQLQDKPIKHEDHLIQSLEGTPVFKRARELWLTGHVSEAYAEWAYGIDKLSARELAAAGVMANSWGWHDRAIGAMIAGKHWDHLNIRFPLAYEEHVLNAAEATAAEPQFIFAIARQESAMSVSATSRVGARGLMQLMPRTARQTASKRGIHYSAADLFSASQNINLGSLYLDELLNKFNGNRILAAAAYNAGPRRVSKWMGQSSKSLPFDVWIETIPFKETRGYVQNVLTFTVIYSFRMGRPESLVTNFEANKKL